MAESTTDIRSAPVLPARDGGDPPHHWAERPAIEVRGTATPDLVGLWDDAALTCAALLEEWARGHAADYGLSVRQVERYVWRSYEDPRDIDLVVEFGVDGRANDALRFEDAVSCHLAALMERDPAAAAKQLWASVRWW